MIDHRTAKMGLRARAHRLQPALKRILDILLASAGLILTLPFWLIVPLAIWLEHAGPILMRQARVGLHGRIFAALKFRSMVVGAEDGKGPVQAKADDPRVTRVGRFLRVRALDELPQLLNILVGDMSLVGPRALRPTEEEIGGPLALQEIPGFKQRHSVRPGLTGLAQVYARRGLSRKQKFRYDLLYVRRQSFMLDLRLTALSIWTSLTGGWDQGRPPRRRRGRPVTAARSDDRQGEALGARGIGSVSEVPVGDYVDRSGVVIRDRDR